jgi:hypothetical protein
MKFFYYCFYRITNAYYILDKNDNYLSGNAIITLCQYVNFLSIISAFYILENKTYSYNIVYYTGIPLYIINWLFIFTKKKYLLVKEKWKNENPKYKQLKGWLIILYIASSLAIWFILLGVMYHKIG